MATDPSQEVINLANELIDKAQALVTKAGQAADEGIVEVGVISADAAKIVTGAVQTVHDKLAELKRLLPTSFGSDPGDPKPPAPSDPPQSI